MTDNPIVWPEHEFSEVDTIADGVVDTTGAFVRTFWHWDDEFAPHLLTVRAKFGGVQYSQGITLGTFRLWVTQSYLGNTDVYIHGHLLKVPTSYLASSLEQIDWLMSDRTGNALAGIGRSSS